MPSTASLLSLVISLTFQISICNGLGVSKFRNVFNDERCLSKRSFVCSYGRQRANVFSSCHHPYFNYPYNYFLSMSRFMSKTNDNDQFELDDDSSSSSKKSIVDGIASGLFCHHTAIKTRDIEMSIKFYSLFGFKVESKFRSGPARAAWLIHSSSNKMKSLLSRIELIEVPSYMLQGEGEAGARAIAIDLTKHEHFLGLNHLALDVTECIEQMKESSKLLQSGNNEEGSIMDESFSTTDVYGLNEYMEDLNKKSVEIFGKTLRVALQPRQQIIGGSVYEISFLYDADGSLLELLNWIKDLENKIIMSSGWEPWDGKGFVGPKQ